MAKIYRASDRIPVVIGDMTVFIAPLTFEQKTELQTIMMAAGKDPMKAVAGARLAVKYAVKSVSGVTDFEGQLYAVRLGDDGMLTDESVDDLLNMEEQPKLIALCSQLIAGVPRGVVDPQTNQPMAGITINAAPAKKPKARK